MPFLLFLGLTPTFLKKFAAMTCLAMGFAVSMAAAAAAAALPLRIAAASSLRPLEAELRAAWRQEQHRLHPAAQSDAAPARQEKSTPELDFIYGATGSLAIQIINGAPFDVLMAADAETPRQLIAAHLADPTSLTQYAYGRLVLLAAKMVARPSEQSLRQGEFTRLAVADPTTAPYGRAALEVIGFLKLEAQLKPKIVVAGSIAKVYDLVVSQNADLGFVALSEVLARRQPSPGQRAARTTERPPARLVGVSNQESPLLPANAWLVPESYHRPIRHDAVAILQPVPHPLAKPWVQFLRSAAAQAVFAQYGYRLP
ncbi:MAG: molybdate ABC transporter substrate-binding protein [Candidatus Symbiobacter sp.]|nr:molybdate ABC transporter substrate-binding protein [Candidatus Symbiobacter sp.]